jgi:signal recognition particle subunit SRP54
MFDALQDRFDGILRSLKGQAKISESNVEDSVREIRRALLEADVNVRVAREFISHIRVKALGESVLKGVNPGQQFVKIIQDEMTEMLGSVNVDLCRAESGLTVIMMVGLQGSGKTTTAAKLANRLQKEGRRPYLVAADVYRPAAVDQLCILGQELKVKVFKPLDNDAVKTVRAGMEDAKSGDYDTVILDTAGRLHIDEDMMVELERIKEIALPQEILFVADAMIGQDAVNAAREFNDRLTFDGVVLTKLDGDTRGGAALSIRQVTGKPLKFTGVGEKIDALEAFYPDRMAQRILGMGDVVSLVEKVQEQVDRVDAEKMAAKLQRAEFDLEDFLSQLQMIKRLGPLEGLLKMIPGVGSQLKDLNLDPRQLVRTEAIIQSMTAQERGMPTVINGSRKKRIAAGSGTTEQDVSALLNQYSQMKGMLKSMTGLGGMGGMLGSRAGRRSKKPMMPPPGMNMPGALSDGMPALPGMEPAPKEGKVAKVNPLSAGFGAARARKKKKKKR